MFNHDVKYIPTTPVYTWSMEKFDPESMGARIRSLRQAKGLNQDELGAMCGVTKAAVSFWEKGVTHSIRTPTLLFLCKALGTDPHYLAYGPGRGETAVPPKRKDKRSS